MDSWPLCEYNDAYTAFYEQCSEPIQRAIDRRAAQLAEKGPFAGGIVTKKIKNHEGLHELRANRGRDHVRFFYFVDSEGRLIFVHACKKADKPKMERQYKRAAAVRKTLIQEPELLDGIVEVH